VRRSKVNLKQRLSKKKMGPKTSKNQVLLNLVSPKRRKIQTKPNARSRRGKWLKKVYSKVSKSRRTH
jgi:hypothetical protein